MQEFKVSFPEISEKTVIVKADSAAEAEKIAEAEIKVKSSNEKESN